MKAWRIIGVVALTFATACFLCLKWKQDARRRHAFQTVQTFAAALNSGDADALLKTVVLPAALSGRTAAEQAEFLTKALRDEISSEGLAVLRKHGKFGRLPELFPAEAAAWAAQAGVNPEHCVAFRLDRDDLRVEVVLVRAGDVYRVVRCNNVKQLAIVKP